MGDFREHHRGVLLDHELILTGFEHSESTFLVEIDARYARAAKIINSFFAFSGRPNSCPGARF
jgi:hypothetical protein